jgi:hypothetical protein
VRESSKGRGEGAACFRAGCSPFVGDGERRGGSGRTVMVGIMALITIDGGEGLGGGEDRGFKAGDVKA